MVICWTILRTVVRQLYWEDCSILKVKVTTMSNIYIILIALSSILSFQRLLNVLSHFFPKNDSLICIIQNDRQMNKYINIVFSLSEQFLQRYEKTACNLYTLWTFDTGLLGFESKCEVRMKVRLKSVYQECVFSSLYLTKNKYVYYV